MPESQNPEKPRDLTDLVIQLLIEHTCAGRDEISLSTRLLHDLGMDGHDAVDFFDEFSEKLNVDINELREEWANYFGPEGGPSLGCVMVILLWGLLSGLLHSIFEQIPIWAFAAGLGILAGWAFMTFQSKIDPTKLEPIRVSDLVASVQSGRWKRAPSDPPD